MTLLRVHICISIVFQLTQHLYEDMNAFLGGVQRATFRRPFCAIWTSSKNILLSTGASAKQFDSIHEEAPSSPSSPWHPSMTIEPESSGLLHSQKNPPPPFWHLPRWKDDDEYTILHTQLLEVWLTVRRTTWSSGKVGFIYTWERSLSFRSVPHALSHTYWVLDCVLPYKQISSPSQETLRILWVHQFKDGYTEKIWFKFLNSHLKKWTPF